jgi:hypothetical protein
MACKGSVINFKVKVKEVEKIFLSEEDLQALHEKEFAVDRLNQVKIFSFLAATPVLHISIQKI